METSKNITEKLAQLKAEYPRYTTPQFIELATEKFLQDPEYKNKLSIAQNYMLKISHILIKICAYLGNKSKTFLAFRKANKRFKTIADDIRLQQSEELAVASYITENIEKFSELQKSYVNSTRIQTKIKNGYLTLEDITKAIQTIQVFEDEPDSIVTFSQSLLTGPPYFSAQLSKLASVQPPQPSFHTEFIQTVIAQGFLPRNAMSPLYSPLHLKVLAERIASFEEIQGLHTYQVQALLETAEKILIPTENPQMFTSKIKKLTHTRKEVENRPLTNNHLSALKKGLDFTLVVKITDLQVQGLMAGLSEAEFTNPHFSSLHLHVIQSGLYEKEKILRLNQKQLILHVHCGISYESVLNLPTTFSSSHIQLLCEGKYQFEAIKDLTELQLALLQLGTYTIQEIKEVGVYPVVTSKLLAQGYPLSKLKGLNETLQKVLVSNPHITVEQVKELAPAQCAVFEFERKEKLTFEEVKKLPTSLHCLALQTFPYKDIINLNAEDLLKKLQEKIDTSSLYPLSEAKREIEPPSPTLIISSQGKELTHSTTQNHTTQKELEATSEAFQKQEEEQFTQRNPKRKKS